MAKSKQQKNGLDPKPELYWVKLTQLYVPTDYQRSVKSDASSKNISHFRTAPLAFLQAFGQFGQAIHGDRVWP